jgi:hypothetical protein
MTIIQKLTPFMSAPPSNASIMLKDSELRSIPASFFQKQLPMLFAESATYRVSKGKKRKCFLVVYLYGVCLFKTQSMGHCKLGEFVPIYSLKEIVYTGPKRREIVTRSSSTHFTCDHADNAVTIIMIARNSLFVNSRDPTPITLRNFQTSLTIPSVPMALAGPPSEISYLCSCFQYWLEPSDATLDFVRRLNPERCKVLCIDESVECPEDVHCLVRPIAALDKYTTLQLRSFVPYTVCRFLHHLIKKGSSIRTIIFDGYNFLVPPQLRWGNLRVKPTESFCLVFRKCSFSEDIFVQLIDELSRFEGEYQRIAFNGLDLTPAMCSRLFDAITTAPPFRTLEVIELDELDTRVLELDTIQYRIFGLMKSHRFLHRLSLADWRTPISVPLSLFLSASVLRDISLCGQDMSRVFGFFALPKSLRLLDLSRCHFSQFSLWNFLENLARHKVGLTVNLSDLFMSDLQWCEFYCGLGAVPKIGCLQELDWSGNPLTKESIPTFLGFFFARNAIRFLIIDRIFRSSTADVLYQFCEGLPKGKLWGLSIGGSPSSNFCGNFHGLIRSIELLDGIATLLLDGQHCSNRDARIVFQYLTSHGKLVEFSCDGSNFDLAGFSDFYQKVCSLKHIRCVGRPFRDLDRLKLNDTLLDQFRLMLVQKHENSTPLTRAFFLASHGTDFV